VTRVLLPVEVEIAREKAASLGRVGERLEASLARLAELRRRIELARPEVRPQLARRYAEERSLAATLRYYLVVQREAIGLRRHADVDRAYPLPPAIPIPAGRETP
jgi:hypothetical protein